MSNRYTYVCPDCGGKNVNCSAPVTWDESKQDWVAGNPYNDDFCEDCAYEIRMKRVDL